MKGCVAIIVARDMRIHVIPFSSSDFADSISLEKMEDIMGCEEHFEGHPVFTDLWEAFREARAINFQEDVPARMLKGGYMSELNTLKRHGIEHGYSKGVWDDGIVFCLKYALSEHDMPYYSNYVDTFASVKRFLASEGTDCVHRAPNFEAPIAPHYEDYKDMLEELEETRPAYLEGVLAMSEEDFDEWVDEKGIPKMLHLIAYRNYHFGY